MKMLLASMALFTLALVPGAPAADGGDGEHRDNPGRSNPRNVRGDYLEVRTCDVWVGSCFANSETSEAGKQATMAWKFKDGAWKGVDLTDRSAVLLIDAKWTLGDRFHSPLPVRNVLLLDQRASDAQLIALRDFVKTQTGELAGNVIEERLVTIDLKVDCCEKEGCAKLTAGDASGGNGGDLVRVETRCLTENDKVCGHEETYYPPLSGYLSEKHPVLTVEHAVKMTLLGKEWTDRDSRSAFLGKFELRSPAVEKRVDPADVIAR